MCYSEPGYGVMDTIHTPHMPGCWLGSRESTGSKQDGQMTNCCDQTEKSWMMRRSDGIINGYSCRPSGEQR